MIGNAAYVGGSKLQNPGHDMQIDGENCLAAVDTDTEGELEAKHSSLPLNRVIEVMEKGRRRTLCREGGMSGRGRSSGRRRAGWAMLALWALWALLLLLTSAAARAEDVECLIEAAQTVELRSPVVGLLEQVHVRRGDTVRAGQLLVTIESSLELSALATANYKAQAQGALQLARQKVSATGEKSQRLNSLFAEDFVSAQARDDAHAEWQLAQAELVTAEEAQQLARLEQRQAQDQLARRQLRSPFNGVVVDQYLYPGAVVDAGEGKKPILKLAQTDPLAVQAVLPFRLFAQVKPGQPVQVLPEQPYGREIAATIRTVDRVIDAASATFGVVAELANPKQSLPAGIRCQLRLHGLRTDAAVPPPAADQVKR